MADKPEAPTKACKQNQAESGSGTLTRKSGPTIPSVMTLPSGHQNLHLTVNAVETLWRSRDEDGKRATSKQRFSEVRSLFVRGRPRRGSTHALRKRYAWLAWACGIHAPSFEWSARGKRKGRLYQMQMWNGGQAADRGRVSSKKLNPQTSNRKMTEHSKRDSYPYVDSGRWLRENKQERENVSPIAWILFEALAACNIRVVNAKPDSGRRDAENPATGSGSHSIRRHR
ncbi:hypothetical protein B0H34DRAFT_676298 [Crassisporium funariophilum]|nr:hypothetical protein B0H34DRAFT_676298 [Crassisporium funariophilum]